MFNSTLPAPSSPQAFSLIWIIETLLCVNLREQLRVDGDDQAAAYHYGL